MKKIFFTILVIFYSNTLNAQESYLCISEAIGGVAYDSSSNKWDGTKFSNSNHKIILKKKNGIWKYADFGDNFEEQCDKMSEDGIFRCDMILGEFIFNSKSKRFIKTYIAGYLSGQDNNDNTPHVMIGTCSPL